MDKMGEMLRKSSAGEIPSPAAYSTIYCSDEIPGLGYAIFNVESKDRLDEILNQLMPYSEVYEIASIMTLQEFQAKMTGQASPK
jgi:hypothetical protein